MIEFIHAPFPFVMGMVWHDADVSQLDLEEDIVVVDLDRDAVDMGTAMPASFPLNLREALAEELYQVGIMLYLSNRLKVGRPGFSKLDNVLPGYYVAQDKHSSPEAVKFSCEAETVYKRLVQTAFFKVRN
jgi:hypothetical protein